MANSQLLPDLEGFEEFFGIKVSTLGEDGGMVALGHHEPKRALAAFNAYAKSLGFTDLDDFSSFGGDWAKALDRIRTGQAVLRKQCEYAGRKDHETNCSECAQMSQFPWWMDCSPTVDDVDTFPVTNWEV
ncbi:hypothetical protein Q0Z83_060570 [Actinoplanes sichuanensis]|uniref:Uncharacterized protein n=1 Tax=Actinoplanes sichuanensis TaxID=512349 RepID=A0ABW4A639_9ACTN|nr:hypothetical protein [Actinoplanes sichuanensis]BEL07866.1 hypothetical protein Q0Z83_060570 [Actinoplanes sichuanensis]